jgi:hypothetical protein
MITEVDYQNSLGHHERRQRHCSSEFEEMATMIKNKRQYRITKAHAEKFAKAIQEMMISLQHVEHPVLRKA